MLVGMRTKGCTILEGLKGAREREKEGRSSPFGEELFRSPRACAAKATPAQVPSSDLLPTRREGKLRWAG